jgi:hypothetical protein
MSVIASVTSRFDVTPMMRDMLAVQFDSEMNDRNAVFCIRFDSDCQYQDSLCNRFDSETHGGKVLLNVKFDATPAIREVIPGYLDALRDYPNGVACIPIRFDSPIIGRSAALSRFDACRIVQQFFYNRFDAYVKMFETGVPGRFDSRSTALARISNRFHAIPQEWKAAIAGRFDAFDVYIATIPIHKQAFVPSGWHILIRNTETDEQRDLGFIAFDTTERAIKDVDLPDGDYEVMLLHSSLFWKDARDRVVRNVTIRSGEEPVLGLPPVLNLTSEVSDGITTISWSSNSGDYEDCEFGLWFAETPPVVTFREPDQRIAYSAFDADYNIRITQTWPLWCVIMAVKGNMRGPATEVYLEWSIDSPRRPDDQMAFDVFIDEKLQQLKNASGQIEGVEWDTEKGYW